MSWDLGWALASLGLSVVFVLFEDTPKVPSQVKCHYHSWPKHSWFIPRRKSVHTLVQGTRTDFFQGHLSFRNQAWPVPGQLWLHSALCTHSGLGHTMPGPGAVHLLLYYVLRWGQKIYNGLYWHVLFTLVVAETICWHVTMYYSPGGGGESVYILTCTIL